MIDDDRFIFDTLKNWYFGEDNTGDIMMADNVGRLKDACEHLGNIHLVSPCLDDGLLSRVTYAHCVHVSTNRQKCPFLGYGPMYNRLIHIVMTGIE